MKFKNCINHLSERMTGQGHIRSISHERPAEALDHPTPLHVSEAEQPRSWQRWRKWAYIAIVSYCDFLTLVLRFLDTSHDCLEAMEAKTYSRIFVSMMLAPSVPQVLEEFRPNGGDKSLGSFSVTVYILGFCVGPLVIAPLTDIYGRSVILRVSSFFFLVFTLGCAFSTSLECLIMFRFFAGCFGGAPMAIGGAVISDMYGPGQREAPMALYSIGTMMGPTLGPVFGGLITDTWGWRWVFRIAAILVCVPLPIFAQA